MTDAVKTGTVTSPYSPDLRAIGIGGTAYKVPDYVEPYAQKVRAGDTVSYKHDGASLLRIAREEPNSTYQRSYPSPPPAPARPAPKKVAPEDLPWNRAAKTSPAEEQVQEPASGNDKQAMSVEKADALAAVVETTAAKVQDPPLRPPMLATDLREHRIYWNGLLNTAIATITIRNPVGVSVDTLSDTVIETARKYDKFIRTQAMATMKEGKA